MLTNCLQLQVLTNYDKMCYDNIGGIIAPLMKKESDVFMSKECRIINYEQALKYIKNGAKPIRCEVSNLGDRIVFIFTEEDTKELFRKWRNYEL